MFEIDKDGYSNVTEFNSYNELRSYALNHNNKGETEVKDETKNESPKGKKLTANALQKKVQEKKAEVQPQVEKVEVAVVEEPEKKLLGNKLRVQVQEKQSETSSSNKSFWDRLK